MHMLPKSLMVITTHTQPQPQPQPPLFNISSSFRSTQQNPKTHHNTKINITPPPSPKISEPIKRRRSERPRSFLTLIFNVFDDIINIFIDPPLKPWVDPRHVLSQNFAPVHELPPTECHVIQGTLPSCLHGVYIRNGPNPQFIPRGPYHLFDGDGMLHSLRISQGKPTLCSRYVKTYKYHIENEAGHALIPSLFSGFNGLLASAARASVTAARILTGQYNPVNGVGLANTSLALFGDRLYALCESDLPYEIRITPNGDIQTLGRRDFDGKLVINMTAHPKIDPETGECFAFRYGLLPPFLTYFRFNADGKKLNDVPIFSMKRPSLLHDFAITKNYAVFADIQLGMKNNPLEMIIAGGSPVGADHTKVSRIGILPRYATDESGIKWFDAPGFNIVHAINAWEEEDDYGRLTVNLVAPNISPVEHTLERMELVHADVEKVRIEIDTGIVSRKPLSEKNLDFAVINPAFVGKRNRFVYAAVGDPMPKVSGVVKLDLDGDGEGEGECTAGCRMYGEGCYGGEPFFVAREDGGSTGEEDDGYLVTYVHDERKGESKFLVMDAKSPELDVVATVKLPRRVPYGFHGLFVKESDLRKVTL